MGLDKKISSSVSDSHIYDIALQAIIDNPPAPSGGESDLWADAKVLGVNTYTVPSGYKATMKASTWLSGSILVNGSVVVTGVQATDIPLKQGDVVTTVNPAYVSMSFFLYLLSGGQIGVSGEPSLVLGSGATYTIPVGYKAKVYFKASSLAGVGYINSQKVFGRFGVPIRLLTSDSQFAWPMSSEENYLAYENGTTISTVSGGASYHASGISYLGTTGYSSTSYHYFNFISRSSNFLQKFLLGAGDIVSVNNVFSCHYLIELYPI